MSETAVMTLRMPKGIKRGVEHLAARFGHKPAQLGVRLIEEGLRRRNFPHIDLRETAAGRVAYVAGTRFAVHWIAAMVPGKLSLESFAREYDVPASRIRSALAYAKSFADEIASDRAQADDNRRWVQEQDNAVPNHCGGHKRRKAEGKTKASR